jgi:alpha-beta hydrolase superfamily lysophospholipase
MAQGVKEDRIDSAGGVKIFVRSWKPAGKPKAIVVICHGVKSHSGQYLWPAEQLAAAGYSVYALDLRGRGKSDGPRFFINDAAEYVADVSNTIQLAKTREPGLPVFLLGHSAGGVVSCTYALDHQSELAGLICESFAFRVFAAAPALAFVRLLSKVAPRLKVLNLKNKDFSRDPAVVAKLDADPLIMGEAQPAKTVAALLLAADRMEREFGTITLPVLIMHGSADKVTNPAGSQMFYDRAGSRDKTLKIYDDHVHDLFSDYGKETVIADVRGWLDEHVAAKA